MFIKKDLRKIPKILDDAIECSSTIETNTGGEGESASKRAKLQEPLQELKLGRRKQEFKGNLKILCQPAYIPKLKHLKSLSLYDCEISDCSNIGLFESCPQLEILNLGRNPISEIPSEFSQLKSLKEIWLDDCSLQGTFPKALCELVNLEVLKMPNNKITELPSEIGNLISLRVLCLDRNLLQTLPAEMEDLHNLQELFLRDNEMQTLSHLPSFLTVLHVSSNQLHDFGEDFVSKCMNLKTLYANGNQLKSLPMDLIAKCNRLQRLVVSHNSLESVPDNFWTCTSCDIIWKPNPQLTPPIEDVEMEPAAE